MNCNTFFLAWVQTGPMRNYADLLLTLPCLGRVNPKTHNKQNFILLIASLIKCINIKLIIQFSEQFKQTKTSNQTTTPKL